MTATTGNSQVWYGREIDAYEAGRLASPDAGHDRCRTEISAALGIIAAKTERIAELERLADELLAAFVVDSAPGEPIRSARVRPADLARWRAIRHSGTAALDAADEMSQLGQELQGGDS